MPHSQTYHFIVANKVSWAAFGFTQFSNTARRDAFQHALCQVSSLKFFPDMMHKLCFAPSARISGSLAQLVATTEACSKKAMSPTAEQNASAF